MMPPAPGCCHFCGLVPTSRSGDALSLLAARWKGLAGDDDGCDAYGDCGGGKITESERGEQGAVKAVAVAGVRASGRRLAVSRPLAALLACGWTGRMVD